MYWHFFFCTTFPTWWKLHSPHLVQHVPQVGIPCKEPHQHPKMFHVQFIYISDISIGRYFQTNLARALFFTDFPFHLLVHYCTKTNSARRWKVFIKKLFYIKFQIDWYITGLLLAHSKFLQIFKIFNFFVTPSVSKVVIRCISPFDDLKFYVK